VRVPYPARPAIEGLGRGLGGRKWYRPSTPLVRARQRGEPHPPKTPGARAYQRPGRQASLSDQLLDRIEVESEGGLYHSVIARVREGRLAVSLRVLESAR
jgi:hypothetical protein